MITNDGNSEVTQMLFDDDPDANTALVVGTVTASQGTVTRGNAGGDTRVSVDIGTLPAGASVTITFRVRINSPLPGGTTQVSNQGTVSSRELPVIVTDDPSTLQPNDPRQPG